MIGSGRILRRSARLLAQQGFGSKGLPVSTKSRHSANRKRALEADQSASELSAKRTTQINSQLEEGKGAENSCAEEKHIINKKARHEAAQGDHKAETTIKSQAVKAGKILPDLKLEQDLWRKGFQDVAGVDEAGRGPLAGPVVAAACVIPPSVTVSGIQDSKKLSTKQRNAVYDALTNHPDIRYAVSIVDFAEIDRINILQAAMKAMAGAVKNLPGGPPDYSLVDGNKCPSILYSVVSIPFTQFPEIAGLQYISASVPKIKLLQGLSEERCKSVIGGDRKSVSIAAASIIAKDNIMEVIASIVDGLNIGKIVKTHISSIETQLLSLVALDISQVTRDRIMEEYDKIYPIYGFAGHQGYPTVKHRDVLLKQGRCPIHRVSYTIKRDGNPVLIRDLPLCKKYTVHDKAA